MSGSIYSDAPGMAPATHPTQHPVPTTVTSTNASSPSANDATFMSGTTLTTLPIATRSDDGGLGERLVHENKSPHTRSGLMMGSSGMSASIYDAESQDRAQIMFSQAVARRRSFQPKVFDFSTKYCLVILAGLVPIITLGIGDPGLGVLVVGKILIMYMGYLVLFARASKTWSDSLTGRWPNTNDPGTNYCSVQFLRKAMHNGINTWLVMISMLMLCSLASLWFVGNGFICTQAPIIFLDDEKTTFKMGTCEFMKFTRNFSPEQGEYFFKTLGFGNWPVSDVKSEPAWTTLQPDLMDLNTEHNSTFDWVAVNGPEYSRDYYAWLQACMVTIIFIVVILIQASCSFTISEEQDERLGIMKDALTQDHNEVFLAWQRLETHCEVFARAKLYTSFNAAAISGGIVGFGSTACFMLWTHDWTFGFVFVMLIGAVTTSSGITFFRCNIAARTAYVTERLHLRAIFLSQMVGGSHVNVKKSCEQVPVLKWVHLREYLIGNVMQTEFGEVSTVVAGILAGALSLTALFVGITMPMENILKDLTLGNNIIGLFALIMWGLLLPLLLQVVAVNIELNLHTKLIGHKASGGDKDCATLLGNLQTFPTYLKLYGVAITPTIVNSIKGYGASAFIAMAIKIATSIKNKTE